MLTSATKLNSSFFWRGVGFIVVFLVSQWSWQALHGSITEYIIIHTLTVKPAAWLVNLITPHVHAAAIQFSLVAAGGGLNILNGCEGMDTLLLLCAAFAVVPLSWTSRGLGLLCGIGVIFVINQARILLLFYAYRTDQTLFDALHSTVTPIAVVLLVSAYFYVWLFMSRHVQPV
ncbi:MAG TPA: hypothetical protein VG962_06720 [Steroidobacteraceae bacterium]|nr:hypothetical protein [Steroidobacteraceae bacterium]